MEIRPPPIHIPSSSSPSSLHSPEPSGTPDLKRVSSHRVMDISGYGNEIESFSSVLDRKDMNIAETIMQRSNAGQRMGNVFQDCVNSVSGVESKVINFGDACIVGKSLKRVENNNEQISFAPADLPSNILPENGKVAIMQSGTDLDVRTINTPAMRHVECFSESYLYDRQYPETSGASNSTLFPSAKKEQLVAKMDANFIDLVEKVASLHLDELVRVSNSICAPVSDKRTVGTVPELQKILDLKGQIMKEKGVKHAVAQKLSNFCQESGKHKEKSWEIKYRELRKEKHALSVRLKKFEMQNPMDASVEEEDASFMRGEMKRLRQEIEEQESLIKGYQIENERGIEKLREVELASKEKQKKMAEEIAALSAQLACLQASIPQKTDKEEIYASLCKSLSLESKILESQAREATLISELEMVKNEKKSLEKKIVHPEEVKEVRQKGSMENLVSTSDASNQCMLITDCTKNQTQDISVELGNKIISEDRNFQNHGDKENLLNNEDVLKVGVGEGWKKFKSLQKKMERLKREYEIKIRELKQQIQKKTVVKGIENDSTRRVKDLEIQICQIRAFYMKKIKGLKEKLNEKQIFQKQMENKQTMQKSTQNIESLTIRNLQEKIALLEDGIKEKSTIIKELQEKILDRMNKEDTNGGSIKSLGCDQGSNDLEGKDLPDCLQSLNEKEVPLSSVRSSQEGKDEKILTSNKQAPRMSRVCANCAQVLNCNDPVSHASKHLLVRNCQDIGYNNEFEARNQDVNHDMEPKHYIGMESLCPNQQLQILRKRVSDMEARQRQREREWQSVLSDTKCLFDLEHDMTQRKWELAMEAKSAEIERFKLELDTILEAAIKIQKAQFRRNR